MFSSVEILQKRLQSLRLTYSFPVFDAEWVCGISRSSINFWERGLRMPSADGILQIASSYGVSTDWLYGITDTAYTVDSVRYSECIHLLREKLLYTALTNVYNDDKYVDELFYEYGNKNSRESYPLEARANVIVSCLYLSGYANYFAVDATRTPAAQQKIRMYEMKEGLLNVVKTKKPFASLLQP